MRSRSLCVSRGEMVIDLAKKLRLAALLTSSNGFFSCVRLNSQEKIVNRSYFPENIIFPIVRGKRSGTAERYRILIVEYIFRYDIYIHKYIYFQETV